MRYNREHRILPSENAVANRRLNRGAEMREVYEELRAKFHQHPPALQVFLGLVLSAAAFWSPDKIKEARTARDDLVNTNRQIAKKAAELAALLGRRSELYNTSGFSSDTHYHVCDVIEQAYGPKTLRDQSRIGRDSTRSAGHSPRARQRYAGVH